MGSILSHFRHDPYFSYERSFERLDKETRKLQLRRARRSSRRQKVDHQLFVTGFLLTIVAALIAAWVHQQPAGTYTPTETFLRVAPSLGTPLAFYLMSNVMFLLWDFFEKRDKKRLEKLGKARKDMLKDLKDSTKYDRISALLKKYDPEEQQKAALAERLAKANADRQAGNTNQQLAIVPVRGGPLEHQNSGIVASAGRMLLPVFDRLANNVIGDDPALLEEISNLRQTIQQMENANLSLRHENFRLREQCGQLEPKKESVDESEGLIPSETDQNDFQDSNDVPQRDDNENPTTGGAPSVTSSADSRP